MKRAAIVADYGKDTGMGHLLRCGSLAKELSDSFSVKFAAPGDDNFPFVKEFAESIGVSAAAVEDLSYVGGYVKADLIIVDSYKATTKFLTDIKNYYEVCAVMDDNLLLPFYDADVVINQNIGAENRAYHARKDTELLLGLKYLILRDEFERAKPIDISREVKNILVTMGGADVGNITEKIIEMSAKHKEYVFDVVVGPCFGSKKELESAASEAGNVRLHHNPPSMRELFSECQAAVSACGTTIYELASMGIPTIGIVTADNQQSVSIEMENSGLIVSAGLEEKLSEWYFDQLFDDVVKNKSLREKMHAAQLGVISKGGGKRVKEKLLKRFK